MRPPRQIGWVISVEDWALIRRLVADGVPQRQVARQLGIGRSTVARAVSSDVPPKYERRPALTSFSPFEPRVAALLAEFPDMPASVIAERVGWGGSPSWFRENVARLRPCYRRPDPADRLTWAPGDAAQCDLWFPPGRIPLEDGSTPLLPVLVITAAHSRFTTGRMIPTRTTEDLLLGSWELIRALGRVPRRLIWDNETGIGRGGKLAEGVAAFTGTLATQIVQLRPRDPESKGIVERRNGYSGTSFMPGRSFASPADFNASSPNGWTGPTAGWCGRCGPGRPIWSRRTGRRCCRCRRSRRRWAGITGCGSAATITSASMPVTTPSTRP
jgi:Helix-turn-helix domain of resolvase